MKLVMIMVDSDHQKDVEKILDTSGVAGYTELPNVLGKGESGRKLGNRAFPGSNTLYFTVVAGEAYEGLRTELKALDATSGPEEGLTAFILNAELVV